MLLRKHPELVIYLFVDSVSAVHALAANADAQVIMPRLRLLIDVGFAGGRTGCRTVEEAKPILDEISLHKFPMAGIGGYEDLIAAASGEEDASSVERYFDVFQGVASYAETQGHFADGETVLTAGGSSYYDVVGRRLQSLELSRPALRILRSGCYVTHDCGTYHRHNSQMTVRAPQLAKELGDLEPSLFVCGLVQSRPEPNLALITMGKRDVGNDADLPIPVWQFRKGRHNAPQPVPEKWNVFRLNDQHTYLRIGENDDVQVGDLMCFGLSHPCTTFDKWRLTHIVDDDWISVGVLPSVF